MQLLHLAVKFFQAGSDIAAAIWQGIKAGLTGGSFVAPGAGGSAFDDSFMQSLLSKFGLDKLTAGAGGTLTAPSMNTPTFLTPIKTDALKTSEALDKVKSKIAEVKKAAAPVGVKPTAKAIDPFLGRPAPLLNTTPLDTLANQVAALVAISEAAKDGKPFGEVAILIRNEAPDNAAVSTRPKSSATANYYR
jgi:hypothetical protein